MFAILRTQKLKTLAEIGRRASHHLRAHPVPNADPSRTPRNTSALNSGGSTVADLVGEFTRRVEPLVRRKDAVRCIEVLLTASPEWFKQGQTAGKLEKTALAWLREEFGIANVLGIGAHYDETSPHVWAMVAPITPDGRLSARDLIGTPAKLSALQDRWAEACRPLKLQRGVKRSGARHTSIRTYYAAANGSAGAAAQLEREARKRTRRLQEQAEQLEAANAAANQVHREVMSQAATALAISRAMPAAQKRILREEVDLHSQAAGQEVQQRAGQVPRPAQTRHDSERPAPRPKR